MEQLARMVGHKDTAGLRDLGGAAGLAERLQVDLSRGVAADAVAARQLRYGRNRLPPPERRTLLDFAKDAANDRTMLILIAAAVLSLILGLTTADPRTGKVDYSTGWIEGVAILSSVFIVVAVTAANDWEKQRKFAELEGVTERKFVTVLRSGARAIVDDSDVVVGDLICPTQGETLSVDAVCVSGHGYVCDESSLTGEGEEVRKGDGDPFFLSGSSITEGADGVALVVTVGAASFAGHIAIATRAEKKDTPLEEKLGALADNIGKCGLAAATLTFLVLATKESYLIVHSGATFAFIKYWEMLTTAVAIVVVAVPEGLPLSVTIALAYSMRQMLEDKNLVRHLAACETMGGATCVLSDKTGTLTTNDLSAVAVWVGGRRADFARPTLRLEQAFDRWGAERAAPPAADVAALPDGVAAEGIGHLCRAVALSSVGESNRTALAILYLLRRLRYDVGAAQQAATGGEFRRFPFTSTTKQSSCVARARPGDPAVLYVKGAAEQVVERCAAWVDATGEPRPLTPERRRDLDAAVHEMAAAGLRTLSVAFARLPHLSHGAPLPTTDPGNAPLTFAGLVGVEEPVRPEVPGAIAACLGAGVRVKMVTGDNKVSALTVARRCGIYAGGDAGVAMEGAEFRALLARDPAALRGLLPGLVVLARATPLDKQRLVEMLKEDPSQVVAVTGDGTNDAPALKAADVGFAMNSGTEVAKGASDIILTDDNFVGVVKAAMWGRNVNDNIRKFIQFQLTVNCAACAIAVIGAVMSSENLSPLKPVQLLWLNLIMDSLAALGLATEEPSPALLRREPLPKQAPIISRRMWAFVAGQGSYQLAVNFYLLLRGHDLLTTPGLRVAYFDEVHLTAVFNTFVLMQVFNFFNARQLYGDVNVFSGLGRSWVMVVVAASITLSQVLIINFGGKFFNVVPLRREHWAVCTLLAAASLPIGAALRMSARRGRRGVLLKRSPKRSRSSDHV